MLAAIYEWIQNTAFYLVIVTAVLAVLPGNSYKKYIRFFTGLVMVLLLLTPVLKLTGMEGTFRELYSSREYEQERQEIEKREQYFEQLELFDFLPEEYRSEFREDAIEVEDIRIGEEVE